MKARCDGAYFDINWEDNLKEEKLIALGWKAVRAIDGANCATWDDIATQMISWCLNFLVDRDRAKEPVVIRNQLFSTSMLGLLKMYRVYHLD